MNNAIRTCLEQHPLFSSPEVLASPCLTLLKQQSFEPKTVLYKPGDDVEYAYLITQGSVKFEFYTGNGQQVFVEFANKGFIIGELEILSGFGYQSRAIAHEKTDAILIPKDALFTLQREHPDFAIGFCKQIAMNFFFYQMISTEREVSNLKSKLANLLMSLSARFGKEDVDGITVTISHNELSDMLNASRQRVNMQLKEWESQQILTCRYGEIVITDNNKLSALSSITNGIVTHKSARPYQ